MKYFYLFSFALLGMLSTQFSAQTTYLWSTGATTPTISVNPTVTTTYYVTITHNGVDYLDSLIVEVNPSPTITGQNTICSGGTTQLTGSGTPAAVNPWISSNTNIATITESGLLTGVSVGSSTITYTNSEGCTKTLLVQVTQVANGVDVISSCEPITWIDGNTYSSSNNTANFVLFGAAQNGCDSLITLNLTITPTPEMPTVSCYETAALNTTTCQWEVSGTQPSEPTGLACWQTAVFNSNTCQWDIEGVQPQAPTGFACWQTAVFNQNICNWEIVGTQPSEPTNLACWETTAFNSTTCQWEVSGNQPGQPTIACYETATFNENSCQWEVSGSQPTQPTLACYQTATFNENSCQWEVSGSQPTQPTLACYQTATFNENSCQWEVSGSQPTQPTLACYQTATFNENSCQWEVSGTQPAQPALECYEIASFNQNTCSWDVSGVPPSPGVDVIQACGPITWIDGNVYSSANNTATFNIIGGASNGCDSLVTLNLSIFPCTQLQASDCGATNVQKEQVLGAVAVQGHVGYRFRIIGANNGAAGWNGSTYILDRPVRNFRFSMIPGSLMATTYSVEVAVGLGNGNYGPYGEMCYVTLADLPLTQIQSSQCGISNLSQDVPLFANQVADAAGYRFRISGPNNGGSGWSGNTFILDRTTRDFKFSMVPGALWGEAYNIDVAVLSAGNMIYGPYGNVCVASLESIPTTQLQSSQCNITDVAPNTTLFADAIVGSAGYRFRVTEANILSPSVFVLDRPVRNFNPNMIACMLPGETYEVDVAVMDANGNFGNFGAVCSITMSGTIGSGPSSLEPTVACYQTATFNSATCTWDISGSQPEQPTLTCYQTATFNENSCQWEVSGTQPAQPSLACYQTATFNENSCSWEVTGSQPTQPTLACYQTATFNENSCQWEVSGSQPTQPTLACYQTATFNENSCQWEVSGSQPTQPTLACYQTAIFNENSCQWEVSGSQPTQPTLACYQTAIFNENSCQWEVSGTQPAQPALECYEIASFNQNTCSWDVSGVPPSPGVDIIQACGPITWIDGNVYSTANNTATFNIIGGASNGCDSLVTLNLSIFPCTQLQSSSCGATDVQFDNVLGAVAVQGHVGYRFRIIGANNGGSGWIGTTYILHRPVRNFRFSMVPGSLLGETYSVEVAVGLGNGNYGPYGEICYVTLASPESTNSNQVNPELNEMTQNDLSLTSPSDHNFIVNDFEVYTSHNPFSNDFGIQVFNAKENEPIHVEIYDMSGKLLENHLIDKVEIDSKRFGKDLMIGMYMIKVSQGTNQAIIKQVKN